MKKSLKLAVFFLVVPVLFLFPSSQAKRDKPSCTLVTQVDVYCRYRQTTMHRTYTQPEKMVSVLNYLRMLQYRGKPEVAPQQPHGDAYEIVLRYSDGRQNIYRQWDYRYLSKNYRPWEKIEPVRARLIYPLLLLLRADG